jgi:hypothetical protein
VVDIAHNRSGKEGSQDRLARGSLAESFGGPVPEFLRVLRSNACEGPRVRTLTLSVGPWVEFVLLVLVDT